MLLWEWLSPVQKRNGLDVQNEQRDKICIISENISADVFMSHVKIVPLMLV